MQTIPATPDLTSFDINKAVTFNKFFQKVSLSPASRLVLRCLIDCWNPAKGLVFPGQGFISEATGVTLRSVSASVQQLKDQGLILTTRKQSHLNYYFTQKFFDLLNISYQMRKNCVSACEKFSYPYIEQKKNKEIKDKSFKVFENGLPPKSQPVKEENSFKRASSSRWSANFSNSSFGDIPPQLKGAVYQKYVPEPREDCKSPFDDYETAVSWLNSLGEQELKLDFIRKRVVQVRKIWNL